MSYFGAARNYGYLERGSSPRPEAIERRRDVRVGNECLFIVAEDEVA